MKNLSKKIGVGVVASSLVVGGAVSTGLVANANTIGETNVEQSNVNNIAKYLGDLEIIKSLKTKYNFKVFSYYLTGSDKRKRMVDDIKDLGEWAKRKKPEQYEKIKDISSIADTLVKKDNISNDDISLLEKEFTYYSDARYLFKDILEKGMEQGIHKVKIGDASTILIFNHEIKPEADWETNWKGKWNEDIDKLIEDKFVEVKSRDDQVEVKDEWLRGRLQVKDIEEDDYKEILKDPSASIDR